MSGKKAKSWHMPLDARLDEAEKKSHKLDGAGSAYQGKMCRETMFTFNTVRY